MSDRKRKEKSNREKKNGYAHDQWIARKRTRNNAASKQTWNAELNVWQRP